MCRCQRNDRLREASEGRRASDGRWHGRADEIFIAMKSGDRVDAIESVAAQLQGAGRAGWVLQESEEKKARMFFRRDQQQNRTGN